MILHFIQADNAPLAKNLITGASYPNVTNVTSFSHEGSGVHWLHSVLDIHAQKGHALLVGRLDRQLNQEPRAGHTLPGPTQLLILDVDADNLPFATRNEFIDRLGLSSVSYIFQHSARSARAESLRGHYFIELDAEYSPADIKTWLKHQNFSLLNDRLQLSNSKKSLKWPLDIVVNDPGRILYIAPPICNHNPITERIIQVIREHPTAKLDPPTEPPNIANKINELREQAALPTDPTLTDNNRVIRLNPGEAEITGRKEERGFIILNLNGGDSWGYYIDPKTPDLVHNFKDEPAFLLNDLDPGLYQSLKPPAPSGGGALVLDEDKALRPLTPAVFRDPITDEYYQILHDGNEAKKIYKTGSRQKLNDFMLSNGGDKPKIIQDWTVEFNPTNLNSIDLSKRWLNLFKPTPYLTINRTTGKPPKYITRLLKHLCVDEESYTHFINWLACIYQTRIKTGTAWLFHGHTGTGKGTLFSEILQPIFGDEHTHICTTDNATETYNEHMRQCLILTIDEFDINDANNESKAFNILKTYISEEKLTIRAMRSRQIKCPNFTNIILNTNTQVPIKIDSPERRLNIPPKQTEPLLDLPEFRGRLKEELEDFCAYLSGVEINTAQARKPLHNAARQEMINSGRTSHEDFFYALSTGDLDFFLDYVTEKPAIPQILEHAEFKRIIEQWAQTPEQDIEVPNYDLMAVYRYITAPRQLTTIKFGAICKHHNISFDRRRVNGIRGRYTPLRFNKPNEPLDSDQDESPNNVIAIR